MVECGTCHVQYDTSARTNRDIKRGKVEPRCKMHRGEARKDNTRVADDRRFWLDRFRMDEIVFMGTAIESYLSRRPAQMVGAALTASGAPPGPRELGGK